MIVEQMQKEMEAIRAKVEAEYGVHIDVPPRCFKEMHGEFIEVEGNRRLKVRFPFDERFTNPIGTTQGGMLCAAIDNVFGPLSYFVMKRPSVTLDMSTRFIRAFSAQDQFIEVEARVVSISSATLVMEAEVRNTRNKLIATASTTFLILQDNMLAQMSGAREE